MKRLQRVFTGMLMALAIALGTLSTSAIIPNNSLTIVAHAAPSTPSQIIGDINSSNGGVLGSDVKNKVTGLAVDIQKIILTVVMAILICSTAWTSVKFSGAGDDAQAKGKLKNALIFQVLGIVFVASYWGLITFGLDKFNLFG